ncbi:SDR family oxidoreductase [Thalassobium sp. R2A62]|jgi:NADP-dependent 3-hydroxy acid dehydrogenase YdfG|uniref:SDR family NAD(P)-dependent oxidoreductase n=1 Tax=Thalassobium sp. R2A62 TaxID=633131 RepID=UPI0001B1D0EF|nr:SDR family NAD(P)-dependent oxidoreductase [Thalassobium sp. R2A62]EET48069.1 short-chain dehydrogenase/reductase SDR [Thalassobium sp. R2A62]MDG1339242.1 SDR family NAD(P)-dependent oxidoreductase [Paracoccaceae bacterium]
MKDWTGKRYWLVGASEGLGRELALTMSRAGVEVIVSARSEDRLKDLVDELPGKASYVTVDVTDRAAVEAAAKDVGPIDGMVYLAGAYWPMKSGEWDNEKAEMMAEVNYLGASRVVGSVINDMVARDAGHIVLTGSLSGFRGLAGTIGYGASKAGIMYLAEGMYADLRKTGVQVQLANPGFIKTRLTDKNEFNMPFIMEPQDAAQEMFEHMNDDAFKKSFPRVFSWLFRGSQFLPDWLYYRIFGA